MIESRHGSGFELEPLDEIHLISLVDEPLWLHFNRYVSIQLSLPSTR